MADLDRLKKQVDFIIEADKIKNILRMNYTASGNRRENDAEHSWHLALMAILLSEHANASLNINKVLKMILIHDIVEIDAGDAYVYDEKAKALQHEKEIIAADRLFNMLPHDQAVEYRQIWDEFENKITVEKIIIKSPDTFLEFGWTIAIWKPSFTAFMHEYLKQIQPLDCQELYVGNVIQAAISAGLKVGYELFDSGACIDLGKPEDLKVIYKDW